MFVTQCVVAFFDTSIVSINVVKCKKCFFTKTGIFDMISKSIRISVIHSFILLLFLDSGKSMLVSINNQAVFLNVMNRKE